MMNQNGDFASEISKYLFLMDEDTVMDEKHAGLRPVFIYRSWVSLALHHANATQNLSVHV